MLCAVALTLGAVAGKTVEGMTVSLGIFDGIGTDTGNALNSMETGPQRLALALFTMSVISKGSIVLILIG